MNTELTDTQAALCDAQALLLLLRAPGLPMTQEQINALVHHLAPFVGNYEAAIVRAVERHYGVGERDRYKLGHERYEKARQLNPQQWVALHARNLAGERFDDMIDALAPCVMRPAD